MDIRELQLSDFGMCPERGFLPKLDPVLVLPRGWDFLDDFGKQIPKLIESNKVIQIARILPVPSVKMFSDLNEMEKNRAMMIYGFGASAYIHSTKPSQTLLCKSLAFPFCWLSKKFEKPPILSYCSYALNNWARTNTSQDIKVDNIKLLQNFINMFDENGFILIHVDIEAKAAPMVAEIPRLVASAKAKNSGSMLSSLEIIGASLERMIATLSRMPEYCSTDVYYRKVRPWIMSFENVVYESVEEFNGMPQTFRGETGAQSSIMPLLGAALGVNHAKSVLTQHLSAMRAYMPLKHRALIEKIERISEVRGFIAKSGLSAPKDAYNYCLGKMFEFRDIHFGYANSYIHQKTSDPRGTGGTIFMPWLEQMRNETREMFLK